jgi:asparagine synthase (glutamine-hydrolysing)
MMGISETCLELQLLLERAVARNLAPAILLSGGLDTSILASIGSRHASLKAFTVAFDEAEAPDLRYAGRVAKHLGLEHSIHLFSRTEVFQTVPQVIEVVHSFDPMEIRNDLPIFIALKHVKNSRLGAVMAGDGCDELFAGYSFLFDYGEEQLRLELKKMQHIMRFSSIALGKVLGVEVRLPFLDPEVRAFAMKLSPSYLIRGAKGQRQGKWILRKTFEEVLPKEVVWRVKTPIEYGTGTTILPKIFDSKISDEEFDRKRKKYLGEDRVALRDKEQLYYYEAYRAVVGVPRAEEPSAKSCPMCNSNVHVGGSYCRTCGAYPI